MTGYYEEVLEQIEALIKEDRINEARYIVDQELGMPYIPLDIETRLLQLRKSCQQDQYRASTFDLNKLEAYLNGNKEQALIAIDQLSKLNVRNYLDLIASFLLKNDDDSLKGILIDVLIEQKVAEELLVIKDGLNYAFIPSMLERPANSLAYQATNKLLDNYLYNYPSLLTMSKQLLNQVFFKALPLAYEEDESLMIALTIIAHLAKLLDDLDIYEEIVCQNGLDNVKIDPNIM
ncbi:MAG: hypothetical protein MR210_02635 [Erysipelotrichaceae bacterium]|nr:hypothetical protein [Erysipelotrichaceae bacterium]MDY5252352.1 hypothetical protein [Erysipelotrichaceae bacterium]